MEYSKQFLQMDRQTLLKKISEQMRPKRFKHVLGVEQAALSLAKKYQGPVEKASIAALTHDYAKERSDEEFVAMIKNKKLDLELLHWGNPIWHGGVGAYFVKDELGINDPEILQAITLHTTGAKDMTLLDKIIYVADYIEAGRDFPGVDEARKLANENLDAAVAFEAKHTLAHLIEQDVAVYPKSLETYNYWVPKMKKLEEEKDHR